MYDVNRPGSDCSDALGVDRNSKDDSATEVRPKLLVEAGKRGIPRGFEVLLRVVAGDRTAPKSVETGRLPGMKS